MQERFYEFKDDDLTSRLNQWMLGVNFPGRYCGFDLEVTFTNKLKLVHTSTGIEYNNKLNLKKNKVGVVVTNTGVIVKEEDPIELTVQNNTTAFPRVDLVYLQHKYIDGVVGGSQAIYGIIEGNPSNDLIIPSLVDPVNQVIIGYLTVPPSSSQVNNSYKWEQSKRPNSNNKDWDSQPKKSSAKITLNSSTSIIPVSQKGNKYRTIEFQESNNGIHEFIIQDDERESSFDNKFFFKIVGQNNLGENFLLKFSQQINFSTKETILILNNQDLKSDNIRIEFSKKDGVRYSLNYLNHDNNHIVGKNNRSEFAEIYSPRDVVIGVVGNSILGFGGGMLKNPNNKWPSHIIVNESLLDGIEQLDESDLIPGTKIIIEAGAANGLTIQANSRINYVSSFSKSFKFGSLLNKGIAFDDSTENEIFIPRGHVIEVFISSLRDVCVINESFSNRIISLEGKNTAQTVTINFNDGISAGGGVFIARKLNGVVTFSILFKYTTALRVSGTSLFTIPEGFRPLYNSNFTMSDSSGETVLTFDGALSDSNDGDVFVFRIISGSGTEGYARLSGSYISQ